MYACFSERELLTSCETLSREVNIDELVRPSDIHINALQSA